MTRRVVVQRPGMVLTASFCAPCVAQEMQTQTAELQRSYQGYAGEEYSDARWEGILVFEELATGDGRFINAGALKWEEGPLPLRWAPTDVGAHGGAVVVGLIETLERRNNGIYATGFVDTSSEYGAKCYDLMCKGMLAGVSVDLDDMDIEVRIKAEKIAEIEAEGKKREESGGYITVAKASTDDEMMVVLDARIRAATLVDIPAFKDACIHLVSAPASSESEPTGLVAAAAPVRPPASWFANPRFTGPTPITVTDDGRVYGHAALWGTCHTGFQNSCVTPPRSYTNYAWFRTGDLVADDGSHIPVGKVTMSTGHAGTRLSAAPAAAHYDDTGAVAADVAAGEDEYGVWISGSVRSTLTEEQLREFRAALLSGDWRTVGGNLEMVALLAVNLPGFPVPRTRALVASGRTATLLAPTPGAQEKSAAYSQAIREIRKVMVDAWAREN